MYKYKFGLVINPYAGIGGAVALKGSDGAETRREALARGAEQKAEKRALQALSQLLPYRNEIKFFTAANSMGADILAELGFEYEVVYHSNVSQTEAIDTQQSVMAIVRQKLDILVFAGGDGTARDVASALQESARFLKAKSTSSELANWNPEELPVVGIPAGVKIHSGVYAITPVGAGKVLEQLITGALTTLRAADVMDIDEDAFRQGTVRARRYAELKVPGELEYMQAVKIGGKESDELVLADIAADVIEEMDDNALYIMGSGSTVDFLMGELGHNNTLLGVDVVYQGKIEQADITGAALEERVKQAQAQDIPLVLVITLIGGQGHLFGRGNQQLTPAVIRAVGKENIRVIATKAKLQALNGRPLRVDTGDAELDAQLSGFISVTTGYHDRTMVAVQG
ncbi:ATP-NAD kinase [Aliidiomarina iranensis]|uniref:ATP-NAD kinase n=1 Tax=Aliidiomarina iranensis TaxID=1434071 RepID=A0A432VX50_9GAMM|nr:ATP-NAD kinase family protein [Aliidiomarina iranensis]RUO21260.1 ATP-NAD kinase [Aliidiomarina iranensis]